MNFFKLYIGDYQRDTAHLSVTEHGAFLLMLQHYYATEKPLPTGKALHRMLRAQDKQEKDAIDTVAAEFWTATELGLINIRADREISRACEQASTNARIAQQREAARKAARERNEQSTNRATNDQPNQTPDTRHQTPEKEQKQKRAAGAAPADLFPGVDSEVVSDFLALRAKHRAPVTETAVAGLRREAEAAGYSLEQALRTCCERGWRGFKAEWVARDAGNVRPFPGRPTAKPGAQPDVLPELTA